MISWQFCTLDGVYVQKHVSAVYLHLYSAICFHSNCEFQLFVYIFIVSFSCLFTFQFEFQLFVYVSIWISAVCLHINLNFSCLFTFQLWTFLIGFCCIITIKICSSNTSWPSTWRLGMAMIVYSCSVIISKWRIQGVNYFLIWTNGEISCLSI